MLGMAEKPKTGRRGRPAGRKEAQVIQARVGQELFDALAALCSQTRRSKNTELVLALESHLKTAGLWPPKSTH